MLKSKTMIIMAIIVFIISGLLTLKMQYDNSQYTTIKSIDHSDDILV